MKKIHFFHACALVIIFLNTIPLSSSFHCKLHHFLRFCYDTYGYLDNACLLYVIVFKSYENESFHSCHF